MKDEVIRATKQDTPALAGEQATQVMLYEARARGFSPAPG